MVSVSLKHPSLVSRLRWKMLANPIPSTWSEKEAIKPIKHGSEGNLPCIGSDLPCDQSHAHNMAGQCSLCCRTTWTENKSVALVGTKCNGNLNTPGRATHW